MATQTLVQAATRTQSLGADERWAVVDINRIIDVIANMMPGALLTDPASKVGTTLTTAWRTEPFTFSFRGLGVTTAAQEKVFTGTTHDLAQNKQAWYVLSVQSNGTSFTITKAADQAIGTDLLPTAPDNEPVIGYLKLVATAAGGTWVGGTDTLVVGAKIASVTFTDIFLPKKIGNEGGIAITRGA